MALSIGTRVKVVNLNSPGALVSLPSFLLNLEGEVMYNVGSSNSVRVPHSDPNINGNWIASDLQLEIISPPALFPVGTIVKPRPHCPFVPTFLKRSEARVREWNLSIEQDNRVLISFSDAPGTFLGPTLIVPIEELEVVFNNASRSFANGDRVRINLERISQGLASDMGLDLEELHGRTGRISSVISTSEAYSDIEGEKADVVMDVDGSEWIIPHAALELVTTAEQPESPVEVTYRQLAVGDRVRINFSLVSDEIRERMSLAQTGADGMVGEIARIPSGSSYTGVLNTVAAVNVDGTTWDFPLEVLEHVVQEESNDNIISGFYHSTTRVPGTIRPSSRTSRLPIHSRPWNIYGILNSNVTTKSKPIQRAKIIGYEKSALAFGKRATKELLFNTNSKCTIVSHDSKLMVKKLGKEVETYTLSTTFGDMRFLAEDLKILKTPELQKPKDRKITKGTKVKIKNEKYSEKVKIPINSECLVENLSNDKQESGHRIATVRLPDKTLRNVFVNQLKRV